MRMARMSSQEFLARTLSGRGSLHRDRPIPAIGARIDRLRSRMLQPFVFPATSHVYCPPSLPAPFSSCSL